MKGEDDNPTIGVLLCTDTDTTIARYSVPHDTEQLFAAKYMTYMPTEEELRREIEQQKRYFMQQHPQPKEELRNEQNTTDDRNSLPKRSGACADG